MFSKLRQHSNRRLLFTLFRHSAGSRTIFSLDKVFNSIDPIRLKLVGPDRACAEWLMRNGAFVRWIGQSDFVESYNHLPLDEKDQGVYLIEEVKADGSSITHHGFPHFKGCRYVTTIAFRQCWNLNESCLKYLLHLKDSLSHLEIYNCGNVTGSGLLNLQQLPNIKVLKLGKLWTIENFDKVVDELRQSMPQCKVQTIQTNSSKVSK